jgi:hypothetical protein
MTAMPIFRERWVDRAFDVVTAAFATVWPGSAAASDARRLGADEFGGRTCEVEFLVDVAPDRVLAVVDDLRNAGFEIVAAWSALPDGFLLVRTRVRLHPYHLHRAVSRMARIVKPYAGIAIALAGAFGPRALNHGVAA